MAYRLKRGESVIRGLKRVAREEMEQAGGQLSGHKKPGRDEAIHDARKSIKKVRALLRLASAEQEGIYGRENARLRDIARRLSKFRDAFAIIETFDELKKKFPPETRNKLGSVRLALTKRRSQSAREEDVGIVILEAATALRRAAKRVKTWPLRADGFAAIGPGLEETFRAGRKALARVRKDARADNLHELRKRVKDHWYHLRLLEDLWTDVIKATENSLKDLETLLGNDHNLVVLGETIMADPAFYGEKKAIDLTIHLIEKYQKELREQSLVLAARIYEEKPRALTRRMAGLWDAWRDS
jgi:CHAD domain-containing protein